MKNQAQDAVASAATAVRDTVAHTVHTVRDHAPQDVLDRAGHLADLARGTAAHARHVATDHTSPQLRSQAAHAVGVARANRTPMLMAAAAAVLTAALLHRLLSGRR
ncbi:hypothetical protein GCM10010495_60780 [Kitasatospora herbaricolor]|uniref:hypothetical protein n=1 Tax=Kitasatospora herbaricolor TaxID=68217 RepID=UPI00174D555C|nr:hypothetical protein [Kitasatospora herbaricolor]MDQ0312754.1 hypothetical protein [Kitasatospora herbaricolor]GGV35561.1 hypothetical protein GCM10010495_60780 [Kitasatospora herbaricolor]